MRTLLDKVVALGLGRYGSVAALVETPEPGVHEAREAVEVVPGRGCAGDHARKSYYRGRLVPGREVTAVSWEVLSVLAVDPLLVGDNLITKGIDLAALQPGDRVRVGRDVVLVRSDAPHRPCTVFRDRTSPEAFAVAARGYRGALFTVEDGGIMRVDDPMEYVSEAT